MLVPDILARNERIHGHRPALIAGDRRITHAELAERARRRAGFLEEAGIGRGDRVAILAHGTPLYIETLFAVTAVGAALVPLNHFLVARELAAIVADADPKAVLFEAQYLPAAEALRLALPSFALVASLDREVPGYPFAGAAQRSSWVSSPSTLSENDVALIVYGAAAGRPKGAMLTHRNLIWTAAQAAVELSLTRNDIYLSCMPLPFLAGTGRLLRFLFVGATIVLQQDFEPEEVLRAIERHRVTHVLFTPAMISRILDTPEAGRYNLTSLRLVMYGGEFIPFDLLKRAIGFFRCGMARGYGRIESAGVLSFLHPEDHSLDESSPYMRRLLSVGKEAIGVELRVVDDRGAPLPPGGVGELVARGSNIFEGYFRDPELSAETLRDGWLRTGDVACVDEEGYVFVLDRKADTLVTGGIPVSPREIEEVLCEHPAVREAAVVPRPDYALGEVPAAIVALREDAQATEEELLDHCRRNLAPFKVPAAVDFMKALPRNSQGKVLKARLREQAAGRARNPFFPRTPRP